MDVDRMARALLLMAQASGGTQGVERDLGFLLDVVENDESFCRLLSGMDVSVEGKVSALRGIFGGRIHPVLMKFAELVIECGSLTDLRKTAARFFELISSGKGKASGELLARWPVPEEKLRVIEVEAGRLLGREVHLHQRVEHGITGGILLKVGHFVIDGTVDHQLKAILKELQNA